MFEITQGKISKAQKVCVYGPEGVGKSSFAAMFPNPLFIDTEGSTGNLDVKRLPKPTSWAMLGNELDFVIKERPCDTIVIDTIDWGEQLCIDHILAIHGKKGIEDFGYGNGYVYEKEEFGRFLNKTEEIIASGINVVLTAHAQLRKFSQPDEIGEYDRWELKLGKKTGSQISPLIKEWSDLLLFANYKTIAVAVDKDGKKFKAQGGSNRVMYTEHHACWDAKNRHGLPAELPFEFDKIAHIFNKSNTQPVNRTVYWYDGKDVYTTNGEKPNCNKDVFEIPKADYDKIVEAKRIFETGEDDVPFTMNEPPKQEPSNEPSVSADIPKALADLMASNGVTEKEIMKVVTLKGYFPENTPIKNYPSDFVEGVLVAAWPKVFDMIKQQRELANLPQ